MRQSSPGYPLDILCGWYFHILRFPCLDIAERHIQLALARITRWADSHEFRFSPTKIVTIHFSWLKGSFRDTDFYLYGKRLPVTEQTRFHGIIFDCRLTRVSHLRDLKVAYTKHMSLLPVLSHFLLCLYRSLIIFKLDYASQVYIPF